MSGTESKEIEPRLIETAPHDVPIFVFCAPHWFDDVRWSEANLAGTGEPGWYRGGWRRVKPTLWYPRDLAYEALLAEVRAGKQPPSGAAVRAPDFGPTSFGHVGYGVRS
jgi:hypothetical protein